MQKMQMKEVPRSAFPCFVLCLIGVETEGLLDYQGQAGIMSIVHFQLQEMFSFGN